MTETEEAKPKTDPRVFKGVYKSPTPEVRERNWKLIEARQQAEIEAWNWAYSRATEQVARCPHHFPMTSGCAACGRPAAQKVATQ